MAKRQFLQLDDSILAKYNHPRKIGVVGSNNGERVYLTPVLVFSKEQGTPIRQALWEGGTTTLPAAKSKVYFSSGFKTTKSRLRELCKLNDLVFTNNYEDADLFVMGADSYCKESMYDKSYKSYQMFMESPSGSATVYKLEYNHEEYAAEEEIDYALFQEASWNWESHSIDGSCFLSPVIIAMYEKYLIDNTSVMSEEDFITASNKSIRQPIDEDTCNTIQQLMKSYDDDNRALAVELIINTDPHSNKHLLWNLFNQCSSLFWAANRNKNYKAWLEESEISRYSDKEAESMINYLENKNELNKDSFLYLEGFARKQIRVYNRQMYNIKVTLKDEWQQYLK